MNGNRYGGASGIIEAGRQESQRLLMERYRRIDVTDQPIEPDTRLLRGPKFVSSAAHNYNYYSNALGGGSVPPTNYNNQVDSSRQYIPMS
jgi:hypothetical protein